MITLLLLGAVGFHHQADTVTYSSVAKPVGAALSEISAATGLKLSADPEANREIVLIKVDRLPTSKFLADLAKVTSCHWSQNGDAKVLKPDGGIRSREADKELEQRRKRIASEIDKKVAELDAKASAEQPAPVADAGEKAIETILKGIDATDLATVGDGGRVVWATNNATQMQKSLTDDATGLIKDWIAQHNQSVSHRTHDAQEDQFTQFLPKEMLDMMKRAESPVTDPPAKALLIAKEMPFVGGLQLELAVYNRQGAPLLETTTMLGSPMLEQMVEAASGKKSAPKPAQTSTKIVYSEDSQTLMGIQKQVTGNPMGVAMPVPIRQKLLRPDLMDPLAYMATDELKAVADHRQEQLMADIPDAAFGNSLLTAASAATTVEAAEKALTTGTTMTLQDDAGVMLVTAAEPNKARLNRLDRVAMAQLLAQSEKKRQPSLDDICAFAVTNESPMSNQVTMAYTTLFVPSLVGLGLGGLADWDMYRLYGSFDETQRQTLRTGGQVPFGTLSSSQLDWVSSLAFGASAHLRSASEPNSTDMFSQMISTFAGMAGNGRFEPTEVMPSGIPPSGFISCSSSNEPALLLQGAGGGHSPWCVGPGELAMFKMVSEGPMAGQSGFHMPEKALVGSRTNLAFVFHLSPEAVMDEHLTDSTIGDDATLVSLSALPSDIQTLVDQQTAALKKSPLGLMQSLPMFHTTPPP